MLSQGDVLKVDFGIHVRGRILDSAFTLTWDHTYDKLLEAVKDATNTGIRVGFRPLSMLYDAESIADYTGSRYRRPSGRVSWADSRNHRIVRGGGGRENDTGYDSETSYHSGPTADHRFDRIPVRPIENFSGHSIKPYRIHGGKSLLLVRNDDPTKMEEGEYFAIETFGSTGRGRAFAYVCGCVWFIVLRAIEPHK